MNPLQSLLNISDTSKNIVQKKAQNTQAVARKELGTLSSIADVSANVAKQNAQEKANPVWLMANEKIQNLANIPKMSLSNNPFKFENLLWQEQSGIPNLWFTQMWTQPVNMNVQPSPMDSITRDAQMVRDQAVSKQNVSDDKVLNVMNKYAIDRQELFDLWSFTRQRLEEAWEDTTGLDDIDIAEYALDTAPEEEKAQYMREGIMWNIKWAFTEWAEKQAQAQWRFETGQQSGMETVSQQASATPWVVSDLLWDVTAPIISTAWELWQEAGASLGNVLRPLFGKEMLNDEEKAQRITEMNQRAAEQWGNAIVPLMQEYAKLDTRTQKNLESLLPYIDLWVWVWGTTAIGKQVAKTWIQEWIETGLKKGIKAVWDIKAPKIYISPSWMVDNTTDYIAKKIVWTATPQDKLFKAQSPTLNVLNKNRDFKTLRNQSDTANDLIVKAWHKPVDTDTRRIAHEKTMQSKWKEIEWKIENKKDLMVDQKQFASILDETIKDAKKSWLVKNLSDITALKKEADAMRKQWFIDLPSLEKKKQYINWIINNWWDSAIGDVYKNGMKKVTRAIGEVEDKALAKIPWEFSNLKKEFWALKSTYEDVLKADLRNQRSKWLNLLESYSRIEWIGDILWGTIWIFTRGTEWAKDVVKWAWKLLLWKSLKKATDVDFLIKEWFENLSPKLQDDIKNMVSDISTIVPNSMGSKQIQIKPTAKDIVNKLKAKK